MKRYTVRMRRSCVVSMLVLAAAVPAGAQSSAPQGTGQLRVADALAPFRWRNIGPNVGGRSIGVAGSSKRPLEYYFGTVGGGLWKTTNAGTDWFPVTDGQLTS